MVEPQQHAVAEGRYPHVFRPIRVGTLDLDHRLVVPPHGGGNGSLLGDAADFEQHAALWLAKVAGGMRWLGGGPNFVRNPLPPGFEPTGVGAHGLGFFRDPRYPARIGELADRVHAAGGLLSVQMVLQGGMPIAPSATLSSYADHRIPHALDIDEVRWLVREYGESAAIAIDAGVDAIEIHANHDDLVQWFLSPLTNRRDDEYGGTAQERRRFLREIVEAIRSHATRPITLGLRLCIDEMIEGGFGVEECAVTVAAFTADGTVDYFSLDVGSNWGDPSYIPNGWYEDHQWAPLCGRVKAATDRPVVYAGRVLDVAQADAVLAAGHADLVAMARATMADPEIVAKSRAGAEEQVRPCIGLNECIHRRLVEGLVYACGVSPRFAREAEPPPPPAAAARSVLVVGGGPAGTELAALCAERGHDVELWERQPHLGGALAVAALARANHRYQDWIDYQARRLAASGVRVVRSREATPDDVLAAAVDVVAVATGSSPRRPDVPGRDRPHVVTIAEALRGTAGLGANVVVVAEDDGPAPLSVADHLAGLGHHVTLVYQTAGLAPLVGKYSAGAMYARLIDGGVTLVPLARLTEVDERAVRLASTYGERRWSIEGVDNVVLACGSVPADGLFLALKHRHPYVHLLGDAYAPRRMVFATRQAWALAAVIDQAPAAAHAPTQPRS
jgi:2,4-dienoyl-CoA reductase-like NADH-dependent reductase (Old Yellow Enzyme family)/thioredoxin reductase